MKEEVLKKANFILLLVKGFDDKFKVSSSKIKSNIEAFLDDYTKYFTYRKDLFEKQKKKL